MPFSLMSVFLDTLYFCIWIHCVSAIYIIPLNPIFIPLKLISEKKTSPEHWIKLPECDLLMFKTCWKFSKLPLSLSSWRFLLMLALLCKSSFFPKSEFIGFQTQSEPYIQSNFRWKWSWDINCFCIENKVKFISCQIDTK